MSIKKNLLFNNILLASQYVIPLIVFPYTSRILGVEKIGLVNFADGIVNYFILFSTLGLTLTGVREVAKNRKNQAELNKVFSELITIHFLLTSVVAIIFTISIFYYSKFKLHQEIYFIGVSKLIFNLLLMEWFFSGMENFKFITIRSILIKVIYVVLIFILVKNSNDYIKYFVLTCSITVLNGIVNFWYSRKYVTFSFVNLNLKRHLTSFFTAGLYMVLTSMYTTFNVAYLGIVSDNHAVGNYTTSLKLYTIIIGVFTALNTVLLPKLSSLAAENDSHAFNVLINKSVSFVSTFCFPVIMSGIILAPQIIKIIAGPGFENAITCFRIIMPLIFIVGFAQILSNQILLSLKKERILAIISFIGAVFGVSFNIMLVPRYSEVGSSVVVLLSELIVTIMLYFCCVKFSDVNIKLGPVLNNFIISIPCALICYLLAHNLSNSLFIVLSSGLLCLIYFGVSQIMLVKNPLVLSAFYKFKLKLTGK